MVNASSIAELKQLSYHIKRRVDRALETFPFLPDEARVEIRVLCALFGRSRPSIWRDVAAGRLPAPVKVGGSSRWRVGDIRAVLKGGRNVDRVPSADAHIKAAGVEDELHVRRRASARQPFKAISATCQSVGSGELWKPDARGASTPRLCECRDRPAIPLHALVHSAAVETRPRRHLLRYRQRTNPSAHCQASLPR